MNSHNRRRKWSVLGRALIFVAAFAAGCDRIGGEVAALQVGDCFDEPSAGSEITDVQHQPCTEAHDAETIAVLVNSAEPSAAYPVVSGFDDYIQQNCVPIFESYTGRTFVTDTEFDLGYFRPTLTGWAGGDRGFTCYVSRSDGAKITASLRSGGASPTPQ